ncbi:hypothetical protein [Clostridium sp.]|uniref:hypothetical protein n=1 Tax=Clostridium sp. TaxID=1506 RepID=UPI0032169D05
MNNEQKEKIKQMRKQGIGYKQIANEIGLSRDSVRGYCKREWDISHNKSYDLNCSYCDKEFKSLGVKHLKYCSRNCYIKDRFWRKEDAKEIADKILEFKKVNNLPKWLKELLLKNDEM